MKKLTELKTKSTEILIQEFETVDDKLNQLKQNEDFKNNPEYWKSLQELGEITLAFIKAAKK